MKTGNNVDERGCGNLAGSCSVKQGCLTYISHQPSTYWKVNSKDIRARGSGVNFFQVFVVALVLFPSNNNVNSDFQEVCKARFKMPVKYLTYDGIYFFVICKCPFLTANQLEFFHFEIFKFPLELIVRYKQKVVKWYSSVY